MCAVPSPWSALADPHRRAMLELLRESPRPVGELVARTGLTQPGTSKHLRVLRDAGLVSLQDRGAAAHLRARRPPAGGARRLARALPAGLGAEPRRARTAPRQNRKPEPGGLTMYGSYATIEDTPTLIFERRLSHPVRPRVAGDHRPGRAPALVPVEGGGRRAERRRGAELRVRGHAARCPVDDDRDASRSSIPRGSSGLRGARTTCGSSSIRSTAIPGARCASRWLLGTLDKAARDAAGWHVCLDPSRAFRRRRGRAGGHGRRRRLARAVRGVRAQGRAGGGGHPRGMTSPTRARVAGSSAGRATGRTRRSRAAPDR